MKQTLSTIILFCISFQLIHAQIFYVKEGSHGNGLSWETAFGSLQTALYNARQGEEIWVAEGTYFPTNCQACSENDRKISFNIPNGVKVYGGFTGFEQNLEARAPKKHPTILSGNIGYAYHLDNSLTVVTFQNVSTETLLDGFIISDGNADIQFSDHPEHYSGGGIFNDGSNGSKSNPKIINCVFLNNSAYQGGAILNFGLEGTANPTIKNCQFVNNQAKENGGAFINVSQHGTAQPKIEYCNFINGNALRGGAIFSDAGKNQFPNLSNCRFIKNKAIAGGAIFYLGNENLNSVDMKCTFLDNKAEKGDNQISQKNIESFVDNYSDI